MSNGSDLKTRQSVSAIAAHVRAGSSSFSCQVEELSTDGAFLRTDQLLAEGSPLEIDFAKPGARKVIHVRARVLRASRSPDSDSAAHPGLDVGFASIAEDGLARLTLWLNDIAARSTTTGRIPTKTPSNAVGDPAAPREQLAAVHPAESRPPEQAKLMLQVKGLLLEIDDLLSSLRMRDEEIVELRRRLAVAESLIGRRSAD